MEYEDPNPPAILIFETDPEIRELLCDILALFRYEAEVMPNAGRVRDRLEEEPSPRLLIAGCRPRSSEIPELIQHIRDSGNPIPIILVGEGANRLLHPDAWRKDAVLVQLTTPVSIDDLIWVIRKTLEKER